MKFVGCDLHTCYQQIAMLDEETGELIERRLEHANGEAKEFYTSLRGPVRVGIEATGPTRWCERLLAELRQELWIGDAARIRAADVRKQKTDARDAALLLELLLRAVSAAVAAIGWRARSASTALASAKAGVDGQRCWQSTARLWPWAKASAARSNSSPRKGVPNWKP